MILTEEELEIFMQAKTSSSNNWKSIVTAMLTKLEDSDVAQTLVTKTCIICIFGQGLQLPLSHVMRRVQQISPKSSIKLKILFVFPWHYAITCTALLQSCVNIFLY